MNSSHITIVPTSVASDAPDLGLKRGQMIYLVYEKDVPSPFTVRWWITRWLCSCGRRRACPHQAAVNEYVFDLSKQEPLKHIGYPAHWRQPRFRFNQIVYESQAPLTVVGMRHVTGFSLAFDEPTESWLYTVADEHGEEREVEEEDLGSEPCTVANVAAMSPWPSDDELP